MTTNRIPTHGTRAAQALATLGGHRSAHQVLGVQCRHAHHVAAVFDTADGLVYRSVSGPHSHGAKDRIDTGAHGSRGGTEYVDLLDARDADDQLPAWCDCGPRSLSRASLLDHVRAGDHLVRIP